MSVIEPPALDGKKEAPTEQDAADTEPKCLPTPGSNGNRDPQTTKGDSQPANRVEKGTLLVLFLTFLAACYAGYEADRLATLTQTALDDAKTNADLQNRYTDQTLATLKSQSETMRGQLKEMQDQSALNRSLVSAKLASAIGWKPVLGKNKAVVGWWITRQWRNVGGTEAKNVRDWGAMATFDKDPPPDFDFANRPNINMGTGRTVITGEGFSQQSMWVSLELAKKAVANEARIIIFGYMEYRDVFPETDTHKIHWCYVVSPEMSAGQIDGFSFPFYRDQCNTGN